MNWDLTILKMIISPAYIYIYMGIDHRDVIETMNTWWLWNVLLVWMWLINRSDDRLVMIDSLYIYIYYRELLSYLMLPGSFIRDHFSSDPFHRDAAACHGPACGMSWAAAAWFSALGLDHENWKKRWKNTSDPCMYAIYIYIWYNIYHQYTPVFLASIYHTWIRHGSWEL